MILGRPTGWKLSWDVGRGCKGAARRPGVPRGAGAWVVERRAALRATGTEETHAIRCVPPVFYLKESRPRVHEDVLRIGSKFIIRRDIDGTGLQDVAVLLQQWNRLKAILRRSSVG